MAPPEMVSTVPFPPAVKERPILFSAPMVRALLDGSKTQTRRVVKPVIHCPEWGHAVGRVGGAWRYGSPAALGLRERGDHWSVVLEGDVLQRMCTQEAYGWGAGSGCPYGQPGDRLWVRETWAPLTIGHAYCADPVWNSSPSGRWHPSIHMPRAASRIDLEITGVRVERLQNISEADAKAEGCPGLAPMGFCLSRIEYRELWEAINGPGSWAANPWVWVVEFRKVSHADQA